MVTVEKIRNLRSQRKPGITASDISNLRQKKEEEKAQKEAIKQNMDYNFMPKLNIEIGKLKDLNEQKKQNRNYADIVNQPDYSDKSKTAGKKPDFWYRNLKDSMFDWGQFKDDSVNTVDYIKSTLDYINYDKTGELPLTNLNRDQIYAVKDMTPDDIGVYNYLFNTEGKSSADTYLDKYIKNYTSQKSQKQAENFASFAKDHPILGSLGSAAATVVKPEGLLYTVNQNLRGKEVDPNSDLFVGSNTQTAARNAVRQDMGKVGGFLYDTGMSTLDSLLSAPLGAWGGAALIAGGAGADTAKQVKDNGGTDKQAMLSGLASGAAEAVFEHISLGNLKSLKEVPLSSVKDVVNNTLKSIGVNASEEAFTELSNVITDYIIMGDLSSYKSSYNLYLSRGYSEKEADIKAKLDMAKRIGMAAVGGALQGGAMAGAGQVFNYASGARQGARTESRGMTDAYVETAKNMEQIPELYNLALVIEKAKQNNQKPNYYQIGELVRGVDQATAKNSSRKYRKEAEQAAANQAVMEERMPDLPTQDMSQEILQENKQGNLSDAARQEMLKSDAAAQNIASQQTGTDGKAINRVTPEQIRNLRKMKNTPPAGINVVKNHTAGDTQITETRQNTADTLPSGQAQENTEQGMNNISLDDNALKSQNTRSEISVKNAQATWGKVEGATIKGIASVVDGTVKLNIETGGQTVIDSADKVIFADPAVQEVYNAASEYKINGAKAFTQNYDGKISLPVYRKAFNAYYDSGMVKMPIDHVNSAYGAFIPQEVRMNAYYAGINDAKSQAAGQTKEQKSGKSKQTSSKKAKGGVVSTEAGNKMDAVTREGLDAIGKATGLKIRIEEQLAAGQANGMYKDGTLYIALDSDNPYMTVAKHELTHAIQEFSPEKYKIYKEFVIREINKNNPKAYNEMVDRLIERYWEAGQTLSRDEAMDEIVADASEMFLKDQDVIQRLAEHDKNLAEKMLDVIRDLIEKIRIAISEAGPKSRAAKTLNENLETAREAERLWVEALSDISDRKKSQQTDQESQFSLKDSERRELTDAQQEYFKDSMIRDEEGNLKAVYHEAGAEYSEGDKTKISGYYFTDEKTQEMDSEVYINSRNPLEVDTEDYNTNIQMWNDIKTTLRTQRGYDGVIINDGEKSQYIVFRAGQIKKTTNREPSIGRRFQLKEVDYAEYNRAIQENKKLREINSLLEEQFHLTKDIKPDRKQVIKVAKDILKKTNSSYPMETMVDNLESIWKFISEHPEAMHTEEVIEAINGMSTMILKKSTAVDKTLLENSREMLDEIKKTPLMISPKDRADLASEGGLNMFRKKYFGKIRIVAEKGIPVDTFYQELSQKYPEYFDENITHPADQLIKIADTIDFIKPIYYNPYGMSMEESVRDLTNEIIANTYSDIHQTQTFADKKKAQMNRLRMEYNRKVNELHNEYKQKYNERLANIRKENLEKINEIMKKAKTESLSAEQRQIYQNQIQKLRDDNVDRLRAQQQRFDERMKMARARRERTLEANKYKNGIKKIAKDLSDKLLHPSEKSHLPQGFTSVIKQLCQTLDFESGTLGPEGEPTRTALLWQKLKNAYAALNADKDDAINSLYFENAESDIEEIAQIIEGRRVNQLKYEELKKIYDIMKHISHLVSLENKTFAQNLKDSISATGDGIINHLANEGKYLQYELTSKNKGIAAFVDMLTKENIKPYYFFKRIGGDLERLYKNVRDGEDKFVENFENGNEFAHRMEKKYDYWSWADDKPEEFVTEKGNKISLTTEEKMYIYAAFRRKQGKLHILEGGIKPKSLKTEDNIKQKIPGMKKVMPQADAVQFTEKDIEKLTGMLTAEQKGYVEEMVDYLSNDLSKLGNEVTNKLFNMDAYTEENYIPLTSDPSFLKQTPGEGTDRRIKRMAFTKSTTRNANNPIIATPFTEVWSKHLVDMSMYNALVLPLEDFQRVWNYSHTNPVTKEKVSVQNAIEKAYGMRANKYIEKLITDINGGIKQDVGGGLTNWLMSKMKIDAVMGNLSVAIQQPSSLARAFAIIDPKYFTKTMFSKRDYQELLKYSPQAVLKQHGYFDVNMGRNLTDVITERELETPMEKIKAFFKDKNVRNEVFSWLPQKMDELTWSHIWNAVKEETKDTTNLKEGTPEFFNRAKERFKEVIDRSQVMDSVFQRSELMRSQNFAAKIMTNFMAEPTVSYNMLYDAISEYKRNGKDAKSYITRSMAAVMSAMVLNSLLKSIITAGRDKNEDKDYAEKYIDNFVRNLADDPLGMVPYVNSFYSVFKGYDPIRPDMQLVQNLYYAWNKLNSNKYTPSQKVSEMTKAIAPFFNVPLKNVSKDIEMIWRNGADAMMNAGILKDKSEFEKLQIKYPSIESSAASGAYYDLLYGAKTSGDNSLYGRIYNFLISNNIKPSDIDKSIENHIEEELNSNPAEINKMNKEEKKALSGKSLVGYAIILNDNGDSKTYEKIKNMLTNINLLLMEAVIAYDSKNINKYNDYKKKLINLGYKIKDINTAVDGVSKERKKAKAPSQEDFIKAYRTGNSAIWKPLYDKMRAAGYSQKDLLALIKQ